MRNKREKGITLIALVIMIIIILIIAGITIRTGVDTVKSAQFMSFQSELTMVQSKVNEISAQYTRENKTLGVELTKYEEMIWEEKIQSVWDSEEVNAVLMEKAAEKDTSLEELKKGFRLCPIEYLQEELGIEKLERNYLINLEDTIVIAVEKFSYEGKNYYMLEQIESSLYNVTYNNQITADGTFEVEATQIDSGYQITITPKHDKYISKWQVKYKLHQEENWKIEENLVFKVDTPGVYDFQVIHSQEVDLGTKTITIKAGKMDENGYYTQNSTINGRTQGTAYNPVIPKGFKPVDDKTIGNALWGDGSSAPSREAVSSGLVIENKDGSQYVWIPVDGVEVKLSRYTFGENGDPIMQSSNTITIGEDSFEEMETPLYGNTSAIKLHKFIESVQNNGGYYIARYEASKGEDGKALSIISQGTPATNEQATINPKMLWNKISQSEASNACQDLYEGIQSDLINSYAWDTAIVFIQKYDNVVKNYSNRKDGSEVIKNTGDTEDTACNIYNMGSNCSEWTTEAVNNPNMQSVVRGADYSDNQKLTSSRTKTNTANTAYNIGFRSILYW